MRKAGRWAAWAGSVLFLICVSILCVYLFHPLTLQQNLFGKKYEEIPGIQAECTLYAIPGELASRAALQSDVCRVLYDKLEENVRQISSQKQPDGTYAIKDIWVDDEQLTPLQIRLVFTAFQNDHPEVFWLSNAFRYAYHSFGTHVCFYSRISPTECRSLCQRVEIVLGGLLRDVPVGLTEFSREAMAYQLLTKTVEYDSTAAEDMSEWRAYTVLGALIDRRAVCEGYARTLQILLNQLGLSSRTVCGSIQNRPHMWNLIRVDGRWYHADATWDDGEDGMLFRYFNLTDEQIRTDHTVAPAMDMEKETFPGEGLFNLPLPDCPDDTRSYYRERGVSIGEWSGQEDERIIQEVLRAANAGETALFFYVPEEYDFGETIDRFFRASPYRFQYCLRQANAALENKIDDTSCRLATKRDLHAAAVIFFYQ